MALKLTGCCVVPGRAEGEALVTSQSISFFGGVDPRTGTITDRRHELFGRSIAGKVAVFPFGKGSCAGSLIMLELVRVGKAPAAIVNINTEPILATGPIISKHFYGKNIPILALDEGSFKKIKTGQHLTVDAVKGYICIRS
jgi:predicted aconitase with swiveling domain